jgi:hypothetical protein
MREMVKLTLLGLTLAASMMAPGAQERPGAEAVGVRPPDARPTVDQILDRYVQALGGRAAIERVTSRVLKGSLQETVDHHIWESYWKAPNKYLRVGISSADLRRELRLKEHYSKLTLKGTKKIGDREAYWVEAVPADQRLENWYFDAQSGLLIASDYERDSPRGKHYFEYYYEDFRRVDGIKLSFTTRRPNPSPWVLKYDEVKHNVPLDDAIFRLPAAK